MFARASSVLALALCASASVLPRTGCSTGTVQCCNSVQDAKSSDVGTVAGLLGLVLGPITGQVGLTCNPITAVGIGGNKCSAQTACCTGNNFNGVLVLGCSPINVNL